MDPILIFAFSSVLIFALFFIGGTLSRIMPKSRRKTSSFYRTLVAGTFFSAFTLFFAVYFYGNNPDLPNLNGNIFASAFTSLFHSAKIFGKDNDFWKFVARLSEFTPKLEAFYKGYAAFLYIFAPLLTLGFILSFVKNLVPRLRYKIRAPWKKVYVFSELNEKSVTLAESVKRGQGECVCKKSFFYKLIVSVGRAITSPVIVFTDVSAKKEEKNMELTERARAINSILFMRDLESVNFIRVRPIRKKKNGNSDRKYNFYLISDDESEKLRHAASVIDHYNYTNVALYVVSDTPECKLFFSSYTKHGEDTVKLKLRRIDDIQSLVYRRLSENGIELFKRAAALNTDKETRPSVISVIIVGLGRYGKEMLKSLAWYCQLPGFELKINAFDSDKNALDKMKAECPDLFNKDLNGVKNGSDAYYDIHIHPGVCVGSHSFEDEIRKIGDVTYAFVCLGNDEMNLNAAAELRRIIGRYDETVIESVVYDSNIKKKIASYMATPPKPKKPHETYNIRLIGDLESFYSVGTLADKTLEADALIVHQRWDSSEFTFYMSDYNYRSSVAKALHCRLKKEILTMPEIERASVFPMLCAKSPESKKYTERNEMEHNAYVMSMTDTAEKAVAMSKRLCAMSELLNSVTEAHGLDESEYEKLDAEAKEKLAKKIEEISENKDPVFTLEEAMVFAERAARFDHIRWNAYMRSEGYVFSEVKNNFARTHNNLVPLEGLKFSDNIKDI